MSGKEEGEGATSLLVENILNNFSVSFHLFFPKLPDTNDLEADPATGCAKPGIGEPQPQSTKPK